MRWCIAVTEKMYKLGIVPRYITRGDECNVNGEDRDYIDFWKAICCFWAIIVAYARKFETFHNNKVLLLKYLEERGMFVCENMDLTDLQYLMEYYYDEIRHRGTQMVGLAKGTDVNGVPKPVDGEILRLMCYDPECDEFLFAVSEWDKINWVTESMVTHCIGVPCPITSL